MFGAVPKILWNKVMPADGQNRIRLSLNCLLIKAKDKCILVDTGVGDKFSKRHKEIYKVDRKTNLLSSLESREVAPEDVDYVINTHLHFDHCGGNTQSSSGKYVPTFPNARYIIQRQEWFSAMNTDEKTRSSYRSSDFVPLEKAGYVEFVDGDLDIIPGIKVLLTNGHTLGHQSVLITSGNSTALYLGDIIPTTYHIKPQYLTGFDLYPVDLVRRKKEIIESSLAKGYLLIFEHDPDIFFGRLEAVDGTPRLVKIADRVAGSAAESKRNRAKVREPRKKKRRRKS